MISKLDLQERVREWGLREDVVEKDYVLSWVLWGIGSHSLLAKFWAFKGGTCLKKCYIETYRFSEDLDFTVLPDGPISQADVAPILDEILPRITEGRGQDGDVERLERLGTMVQRSSLCGLGQTAPNPALSTIRHFRAEYDAHIAEKRCPAGACKGLISFCIDPDTCVGCGACLKACPVAAITGQKKQPHVIDPEKCIQCGQCKDRCKFEAVLVR